MNIEILGPRGSGKTILGKSISSELQLKYISLGEISRAEIRNDTQLGREMSYFIDNKILYPKGFLKELIRRNISDAIESGGFVLDGYPRQRSEAIELKTIMEELNTQLDIVIDLDTPPDIVKQRAEKRLICTSCDYQGVDLGTNTSHDCPNCKSVLSKREDDRPEEIERMYNLYVAERDAILDILRPITVYDVLKLDGTRSPGYLVSIAIFHLNNFINSRPNS